MAWAKDFTTDGDGTTSFDSTLTGKKFNNIMTNSVESTQNQEFRFNSDTSTNYSRRWESNGTEYTQTSISGAPNAGSSPSLSVSYLVNIATEEKLIMSFAISAQNSGAGNAPAREAQCEKWVNTSDAITTITWKNESTSVNFTSSSNISGLGSDSTASLNVQDGAIYYDTTLNKEYVLYNNTWTEV
jgi:hypothetical protein